MFRGWDDMAKKALVTKPERSDDFKEALQEFKASEERWRDTRKRYIEDVKFARLGEQWPDVIKKQREQDGRPCLTINKLPAFIRQVVNDARKNKPAIKVRPVDSGADIETAEVIGGLIRNIEYQSNADLAYDTALDCAVSGGFGFFRIDLEYADEDTFTKELRINPIPNPLTVYPWSRTTRMDSEDWKCCFVTELITEDEHKVRFPGKQISNFATDDRDEYDSLWFEEKLIRIAEYWRMEEVPVTLLQLSNGSVLESAQYMEQQELFTAMNITVVDRRQSKKRRITQRLMNGYEFLEDETEWAGRYIPIIPLYGEEVNIEGERIFLSLIRPAKDPQMMFNFWRSASTELVALAPKSPWIGPKGAFKTDADKWETANTDNHAYIEYDGNIPPERQPFSGPPAGALQEALNASDDIKSITGIYDAALGARSNETSGRAIMARQKESDTGTYHFIDNEARAIGFGGRVLVDLIPKVYSAPQVVRTLGLDGTNESVKVNEPHTDQEGMVRMYSLTTGKYDVTCEAGPSYNTQRQEAAEQMTEFVRAFPQAAPLIGDLLAKNMDWPGADEIADRLKLMLPPQIKDKENPVPPQIQQQMQQMQQALQQLMQENTKLKEDKSIDHGELEVKRYTAETDRLKITAPAMTPQEIQMLVVQTIQQVLTSPDLNGQPPMPQMMPPSGQMPQNGVPPHVQ